MTRSFWMAMLLMGAFEISATGAEPAWVRPEPPQEIAALLKGHPVTFEFYDPARVEKPWPGLTHFDANYSYRSRNEFALRSVDGQRRLVVRPLWQSIRLKIKHRVELPIRLQRDDFWDQPLTRHELDHVRIGTSPTWEMWFEQRLREIRELEVDYPAESRDSPSQRAKRAVDEAAKKVFTDLLGLVEIRFRELDRVTEHGRLPLDPKFWE